MGVLQCGANSSIVDRNGQANSPGQVVQLCACAWEWSGGVKDCRVICTIPYHNARSYAHLDRRESASIILVIRCLRESLLYIAISPICGSHPFTTPLSIHLHCVQSTTTEYILYVLNFQWMWTLHFGKLENDKPIMNYALNPLIFNNNLFPCIFQPLAIVLNLLPSFIPHPPIYIFSIPNSHI